MTAFWHILGAAVLIAAGGLVGALVGYDRGYRDGQSRWRSAGDDDQSA